MLISSFVVDFFGRAIHETFVSFKSSFHVLNIACFKICFTAIPFLDAQEVVNNPPVPLEGVGILLKAQSGYGGFIAPKIKTFDYSHYTKVSQFTVDA